MPNIKNILIQIFSLNINEFIQALEKCSNQDYFEYGIEILIKQNIPIYPLDISSNLCMEIDFREDLDLINKKL